MTCIVGEYDFFCHKLFDYEIEKPEETIESINSNCPEYRPHDFFDETHFCLELLMASVALCFVSLEDESDFFFCDEFSLHTFEYIFDTLHRLNEGVNSS